MIYIVYVIAGENARDWIDELNSKQTKLSLLPISTDICVLSLNLVLISVSIKSRVIITGKCHLSHLTRMLSLTHLCKKKKKKIIFSFDTLICVSNENIR